jgi:hypothetical protein
VLHKVVARGPMSLAADSAFATMLCVAVGILLVCVVLQTSRYGLPEYGYGTAGDYGTFQLVLMLCVIPVIAYALFKNVQSAAAIRLQATARHAQQEVANPTFDAEGAEGPDIFEDESLPTKTGPTLG